MKIKSFLLVNLLLTLLVTTVFADFGSLKVIEEQTFKVTAGERLTLNSDVGDVKVNTWDKDEVYIKILANKKAARKMRFSMKETGDGVTVIGDKRGSSWTNWFNSLRVKYEIMVPAEFDTDIKTAGGDVTLNDLTGRKKSYTSGGDVSLTNCTGIAVLKTSGGRIAVKNNSGNLELKTSGGDIIVRKSEGDVYAKTSGGSIKLYSNNGAVTAGTSGGDIEVDYDGPNEGMELKTSGGDIDIILPADFAADVELKTSGGDVESDFSASRVYEIRSSKMEAEFNGGGKKLVGKTSGGDITVKQK